MKKERKMKKIGFTRKILDDFLDFVSELCLFPEENHQPVLRGYHGFFQGKVSIFIGRETKTRILQTKINEKSSLRSADLTIIIL